MPDRNTVAGASPGDVAASLVDGSRSQRTTPTDGSCTKARLPPGQRTWKVDLPEWRTVPPFGAGAFVAPAVVEDDDVSGRVKSSTDPFDRRRRRQGAGFAVMFASAGDELRR